MAILPALSDRKYRRSHRAVLLPQKLGYREFESPEASFHGASISGAVFNLSTTIVGAGVAADAFGAVGRNILQACIVINNTGMLVVYIIIIGDVLSGTWKYGFHHMGILEEWFGEHWYTSALSVGFAVVFVAITAGVTIVKLMEGKIGMSRLMPKLDTQASFWKLFTTVPVLVTAYICHHNIHPIENELKDPTQMKLIVSKSLIFCTAIYIATSFFGVLLFGDHILDDVLSNFDADLGIPYSSLLDDFIRLVFFSLRLNVDGLLFPYAIPIAISKRRFVSTTVALMGFVFMGANFIPSIWDAFQFTGATAAVCVSYIAPAASPFSE
ncbi:putative xyloglucan glycosyltransferase 12 [Hibiscus syriacus]|uniref:Xyloglucan glycosyltransferase 12 n=1 Tax=Hibiscus syriacus TaxID=106335 RepID=A0A6A2Z1S7_HIBSY|nr:putative xyloglucan glycosyltransferase 12 [Hibiscus syriacus]